MRQLTTTIDLPASAEQVWARLTDLADYPRWNPFIVSAAGTIAVGERLELRMRFGGRTFTVRPVVTDARPGTVLRWAGRAGVPGVFDGDHVHRLEPLGRERTRYHHTERVSGLAVPFLGRMIDATEEAFDAMNRALRDDLARAAERASTDGGRA